MCGIFAAASEYPVSSLLVEGLKSLEYRGYDSAGIAVVNNNQSISLLRSVGKVANLAEIIDDTNLSGNLGIAHTRWATHGGPVEYNAHPQISNNLSLVHNGIIENYLDLKKDLLAKGYEFLSETDTEVIAHYLDLCLSRCANDPVAAIRETAKAMIGSYAISIIFNHDPKNIYAYKQDSPLVIGQDSNTKFIASDVHTLSKYVKRTIDLIDGDLAIINKESITIFDSLGNQVVRESKLVTNKNSLATKGRFKHYMLKEIYDQPQAILDTLLGRLTSNEIVVESFGFQASTILKNTKSVMIVACGTSYHAGLVAKYWIESIASIPCQVEIASEFRYREIAINPGCLFVCISQSGETADTIAALSKAKKHQFAGYLAICNMSDSKIVKDSDLHILTRAGQEIGVAATKSFTTQLSILLMLASVLSSNYSYCIKNDWDNLVSAMEHVLKQQDMIKQISSDFVDINSAIFIGRGMHYPIALEGALKLKEVAYTHAEGYAAGELKHGPLALVTKDVPVVAIAPDNSILTKILNNLHEVTARGATVYLFTDQVNIVDKNIRVINMPTVSKYMSPILYTLPLQLLAYHVSVLKGTDVDQPRNLAKSVTVE